jgi:hypothetical protein
MSVKNMKRRRERLMRIREKLCDRIWAVRLGGQWAHGVRCDADLDIITGRRIEVTDALFARDRKIIKHLETEARP